MFDEGKRYLARIVRVLGPQIEAGFPIIVLEPSCASVFRDELVNLFPDDARARKLRAQTFLLSEFLRHHAPGYQSNRLSCRILVHGHCHQKALMKMTDEEVLLREMGAEVLLPDSRCCGLAGGFGFEKDKFEISQAIGERVLLPAVRRGARGKTLLSAWFNFRGPVQPTPGARPPPLF